MGIGNIITAIAHAFIILELIYSLLLGISVVHYGVMEDIFA